MLCYFRGLFTFGLLYHFRLLQHYSNSQCRPNAIDRVAYGVVCGFTKKKNDPIFSLNFCFNLCRSSWLCCSPIYLQMASLSLVWFLVPFWLWRQFSNSLKAFWQSIDCKNFNVIPKSYTTPILWFPSPCTMPSLSRMMRTAFDVPCSVPKKDMTKL